MNYLVSSKNGLPKESIRLNQNQVGVTNQKGKYSTVNLWFILLQINI